MLAAYEITSGLGLVVSIVVMGGLLILWVTALGMLIADSISIGAKIVWFVLLTCLAPIAIPIYLLTRTRRLRTRSA